MAYPSVYKIRENDHRPQHAAAGIGYLSAMIDVLRDESVMSY